MEGSRVGGLTTVALEANLSPVSGWPTACATISCDYCKAVLSFQGLPAVRWEWYHIDHILKSINNVLQVCRPPIQ